VIAQVMVNSKVFGLWTALVFQFTVGRKPRPMATFSHLLPGRCPSTGHALIVWFHVNSSRKTSCRPLGHVEHITHQWSCLASAKMGLYTALVFHFSMGRKPRPMATFRHLHLLDHIEYVSQLF